MRSPLHRFRWVRPAQKTGKGSLWLLSPLLGLACLYQPDERCGKDQVLKDGLCVCSDGLTLEEGKCVEKPLYEGLADPCESDEDCPGGEVDRCVDDASTLYCSVGSCASSAQCPENYVCQVDAEDPACFQGPTGFGEPCEESADCAEYEASHCETALEKICMVACTDAPENCEGDWACCDFSSLIGVALCVSPADFEDGECPFGVDRVEAP